MYLRVSPNGRKYHISLFESQNTYFSLNVSLFVLTGYCRSPELDSLQFSVALGEIVGPLETEYGYHLILVSERTNCPKLDGDNTLIMQTRGDDVFGTLYEGKQVGKVDLPQIMVDQVQFWALVTVAVSLSSSRD